MAFDSLDDLNHTFAGIFMAKQQLAHGVMRFINYYNNFGTPLFGDVLTNPFAIHAIPYYFTDVYNYPLVLTINRFVLCIFTLTLLFLFYRTFSLSIFSSIAASVAVFLNFSRIKKDEFGFMDVDFLASSKKLLLTYNPLNFSWLF
jgi:hypothetical protein